MSELIEALLVLSRISRHTLHREMVDMSTLAESVEARASTKDPMRAIEVTVHPDMHVPGDPRLFWPTSSRI